MSTVLEHLNIASLRHQSPTFKGLVTAETRQTYEEVFEGERNVAS